MRDGLSQREWLFLNGIAIGKTAKQMAQEHNISNKTVETYLSRAKKKLNIKTREEVCAYLGLVTAYRAKYPIG